MATQRLLFDDPLPAAASARTQHPKLDVGGAPLWTADKSRLIDEYIHRFLVITKHGVYLDLFAGPQRPTDLENWSVRRVLERRTEGNPMIRHYAVCDIDPRQAELLRDIGKAHRSFHVYADDANKRVHEMLKDAKITPKTACFCLIDQRTFECDWATVRTVARHKAEGYKIEIFYFLAQGWLDRAWASTRNKQKLAAWWGRGDYDSFRALSSVERANALRDRFCDELGYKYTVPFSIHAKGEGSRTMYYMIHASDHPAACGLMARAYAQARPEGEPVALKFW